MRDDEQSLPQTYGLPKLRRAALERLARAYADDDLELEDYERRTGDIHAAETVQEIARVMADVPDFGIEGFGGRQDTGEQPPVAPARSHPAPSSFPAEQGDHGTAVQVLGDREIAFADFRGGAMHVFCLLGDTRIDLTDLGPRDTVVVTDHGALGDVVVRVPAGTEVVEQRVVILGDFKRGPARTARGRRNTRWKLEKHGGEAPPRPARASRVVLRGFRLLGDTKIIDV